MHFEAKKLKKKILGRGTVGSRIPPPMRGRTPSPHTPPLSILSPRLTEVLIRPWSSLQLLNGKEHEHDDMRNSR